MKLTFDARRVAIIGGVVVGIIAIAALLILLAGASPLDGLRGLIEGVSSSPYRFGELLVGTVPIAIIALTLIPALRAGVFSVGAEGQVTIGAITATASIFGLQNLFGDAVPAAVYLVCGAVAGAIGGGAFALLPALLAVRWNVNEILSTLLLNYVATGILGWSLRTWLASGENTATPQSALLPDAAAIPTLIEGTRAHWGLVLVVVVAAALMWWQRTSSSARLTVFASRPKLARRLGTTRSRTIYTTMLISGLGAGLVGWIQVSGINDRLMGSVSGGVGFSGIAVALLGALVPSGIVIAALFFSALAAGALGMQSATGSVPTSIAEVIKGVILLGVACIAAVQKRPAAIVAPTAEPTAADDDPPGAGSGTSAAVEDHIGLSESEPRR
ncbi:simple sugar transport system permease protein [Microbacterium endophyticum]|uniref:Simple sugar transport system permease protein n=1 Tax=Microbacterium endophyticum TaxID=1526412 RepID=A0A7W4V617_9MICO|nr:ABC transporter permease [Microbacterium endophyticum]MBB2976910.1 simple sugar transport system permease protein [Microbacterium endophyticum]NIK35772.1 simple sugar transport system permease protein [Microbacterium endophyticum]